MKKTIYSLIFVLLLSTSIQVHASDIVYVTKTGSCYHIEGCSYLKSSIPITLEDAKEQGYSACSRCKPDSNLGERYQPKSNSTKSINTAPATTKKPTSSSSTVHKTKDAEDDNTYTDFIENLSYLVVGGCAVGFVGKKIKKK